MCTVIAYFIGSCFIFGLLLDFDVIIECSPLHICFIFSIARPIGHSIMEFIYIYNTHCVLYRNYSDLQFSASCFMSELAYCLKNVDLDIGY